MKLTRRKMLAGSATLGIASLLPASAHAIANGAAVHARMVIDPTIAAASDARRMARDLQLEHAETGHDLAPALYGAKRHWLASDSALLGVTGHAGFIVASGIARERRLPPLKGWLLRADGPRALPGSGDMPRELAALAAQLPADGRTVLWNS